MGSARFWGFQRAFCVFGVLFWSSVGDLGGIEALERSGNAVLEADDAVVPEGNADFCSSDADLDRRGGLGVRSDEDFGRSDPVYGRGDALEPGCDALSQRSVGLWQRSVGDLDGAGAVFPGGNAVGSGDGDHGDRGLTPFRPPQ
jgi:hypothetical protein